MKNFENDIINSLDRRNVNEREHPVITQIYPEVQRVLSEDAIDPRNFIPPGGDYSREAVEKDLALVERIRANFVEDNIKRVANTFEAIVFQHTELSNWLGQNAETIRPSEYDDFINGVDMMIEFNDEDTSKHLALGVDVTFGSKSMEKKIARIKKEIDEDILAEVKYFEAHGFQGKLKNVPRVVIGVDMETVTELAGLWLNKNNKALGEHFVKDVIIEEIIHQVKAYLSYAENINAQKAVRSYTMILNTIRKVREENPIDKSNIERRQAIMGDKVFKDILEKLAIFKTEEDNTEKYKI